MSLTDKQRRILKVAGLVTLGLVVFLFALARSFPYDRLEDRLVEELSSKYDVTIGEIRPGLLPGNVVIDSFKLQTRPTSPDETPTTVYFETVEIDIGLLALLRNRYDVDVVARVTGGALEAEILVSKSKLEAEIHTASLPLQGVPGVSAAVGLPMAGDLNADFDLEVPLVRKGKKVQPKWSQAAGNLSLTCTGCTIGDGKAQLKMRPRSGKRRRVRRRFFEGKGLTVPRLRLGQAVAEVEFDQGVGEIKAFSAKSPDGHLSIEGQVRLAEPFKRSTLPGCMRFKLSDELKKREPDFGNIEFLLPERSRQDDGSFAIPTKGTLAALRWNIKKRCDEAGGDSGRAGSRQRPTITAKPPTPRPAAPEASDRGDRDTEEVIEAPGPRTTGPALDEMREAARAAGEERRGERRDEEDGEGADRDDPAVEVIDREEVVEGDEARPPPEGELEDEGEVEGELEEGEELDEPVVD